jgi:hypothetical protein
VLLFNRHMYECEACSESTLCLVDRQINTAELKNMRICEKYGSVLPDDGSHGIRNMLE